MTNFIGTNGNDTFNGNTADDQVNFSGNAAGYRIEFINGFVQVVDADSSDGDTGTDTLTGIETLIFSDRSYALRGELERSSGEARVNTTTIGDQNFPVVTALADGGYVVTWTSFVGPMGVYAQRYDADGLAIGAETRLRDYEEEPIVTALSDGGYLVTWMGRGLDDGDGGIYAQRYNADGIATGSANHINSFIANTQDYPAVTALADGGYVITWRSTGQDGWGSGIYAQRYNAGGLAVGSETQVNTTAIGEQIYPAVTSLADGGYIICWISLSPDSMNDSICAQRYNANGIASGSEIVVPVNEDIAGGRAAPQVAALADGGFVISWVSYAQDDSLTDIHAQRYGANGLPIGGEALVNTWLTADQYDPGITALSDGGYLITWISSGQNGTFGDIYAQRYDAGGHPAGGEVRINTTTDNDQWQPAITALADGGYIVTWTSLSGGGDDWDVFSQRFDAAGNPVTSGLEVTGTATEDVINGGAGRQTLLGLSGNDSLDGGGGEDRLEGGDGNDVLIGGEGMDMLIGGNGDDAYVLSNPDTIVERSGGGTDFVEAGFSFTLGRNIENLSLVGFAAIKGTGNGLDNIISGNSASNTLYGLNGNDYLDGAGGNDRMVGGNGNDTYVVRALGDIVSEFAAGGVDTVRSFLSVYTLGAYIENATLLTSADGRLTGNSLDNTLAGASGNDILNGGMGYDTARYAGSVAGYRIETLADGRVRIVDINSADGDTGADTLNSIEQLDFNGTHYILSQVTTGTLQGEVRINSEIVGYQEQAAIAALSDGGYVISWTTYGADGSDWDIHAQRYNANGVAVGGETRINTYTSSFQYDSAITAIADGGYVVTWASYNQDGSDWGVYAQRFNALGSAIGGEVRVNSYTADNQESASITALADGGYLVTWSSTNQDEWGSSIYAQRYNASGNIVGTEARINTYSTGNQTGSVVTALNDGGYLITWVSAGQDGSLYGIYAQRFDSSGNTVGSETRINTQTGGDQSLPAIAALNDGGYIVSWSSAGQDGSGWGVYAQRVNANGNMVGSETRINTHTSGDQFYSAITALDDGGYAITWTSFGQDGSSNGIYAQRYNANGNTVGSETRINTHVTQGQFLPAITALADGGYLISWASSEQDGSGSGIYAQRFNADGSAWGPTTLKISGTNTDDILNGGSGNQILDGGAGNDTLDGGSGSDTLIGGSGNDIFMLAEADTIVEAADGGNDTVKASISYTLSGNLERLTLNGNAAINGTGNAGNNTLSGNNAVNLLSGGQGNDTLNGNNGNDTLNGGQGQDLLNGGNGKDVFLFSSALSNNVDTLGDFSVVDDLIQLDKTIFKKLTVAGALDAGNFRANVGGNAADANDYIVYDTSSGQLFYDADGNGAGAKAQFALIGTSTHPALTAADFLII